MKLTFVNDDEWNFTISLILLFCLPLKQEESRNTETNFSTNQMLVKHSMHNKFWFFRNVRFTADKLLLTPSGYCTINLVCTIFSCVVLLFNVTYLFVNGMKHIQGTVQVDALGSRKLLIIIVLVFIEQVNLYLKVRILLAERSVKDKRISLIIYITDMLTNIYEG